MLSAADITDPSDPSNSDEETETLPDRETIAFLSLWRSKTQDQLSRQPKLAEELEARLLTITQPRNEVERMLITATLSNDLAPYKPRHPATLLAERLSWKKQDRWAREAGDFAASWLLVAALKGDQLAILALAQLLLQRADRTASTVDKHDTKGRRKVLWLNHLAASWFKAIPQASQLLQIHGRAYFAHLLAPTKVELRLEEEAQAFQEARTEFEKVMFSLCNMEEQEELQEVGVPHKDAQGIDVVCLAQEINNEGKDGPALRLQYSKLTEPLPLLGGEVDVGELVQELNRRFPWLHEANKMVGETLRAMRVGGRHWFQLPPLLLLGPAGTGKTAYAMTLAKLAGTSSGMLMFGGSSDNRSLAGTARGWSTVMPGLPIQFIVRNGCANPLVIGDELDKVSINRHNGNVQDTLLSLIEPTSSKRFFDEALLSEVDLSFISWVFTANDDDTINETLLSRLSVIRVGLPGPEHAPLLYAAMLDDVAGQFGLETDMLPEMAEEVRADIVQRIADGVHPLRKVKAAIRSVVAKGLSQRHLH